MHPEVGYVIEAVSMEKGISKKLVWEAVRLAAAVLLPMLVIGSPAVATTFPGDSPRTSEGSEGATVRPSSFEAESAPTMPRPTSTNEASYHGAAGRPLTSRSASPGSAFLPIDAMKIRADDDSPQ